MGGWEALSVNVPGPDNLLYRRHPFFQNWLAGTLFYSAILFGGFALAERKLRVFATARG